MCTILGFKRSRSWSQSTAQIFLLWLTILASNVCVWLFAFKKQKQKQQQQQTAIWPASVTLLTNFVFRLSAGMGYGRGLKTFMWQSFQLDTTLGKEKSGNRMRHGLVYHSSRRIFTERRQTQDRAQSFPLPAAPLRPTVLVKSKRRSLTLFPPTLLYLAGVLLSSSWQV